MPVGLGELLLVGVLVFVVFGPRRKGAPRDSVGKWLLRALAVVAPAALVMDRVGATLKLAPAHRLLLVGASVAATGLSMVILAWMDRERRDRKTREGVRELRDGGRNAGGRDPAQRR